MGPKDTLICKFIFFTGKLFEFRVGELEAEGDDDLRPFELLFAFMIKKSV